MFMKINEDKPNHNLMFRDEFHAKLKDELYGKGQEVREIVEVLFNLEHVLEIEPSECSHGSPVRERWVELKILTKPMNNEDEIIDFANYLNGLTCVQHAQGIYWLNPTAEETSLYVYGGKRSKL